MNLEIYRGDRREISVVVSTISGTSTTPANLTGKRIIMTAKYRLSDTDANAVFQKVPGDGVSVAVATSGTATVLIEPEDTNGLDAAVTNLYWDIQIDDNPGSPFTLGAGTLTVLPDVTRLST